MLDKLPPGERLVVEALLAHGKSTAVQLEGLVPGKPSNSAIRVMLSRLEKKGVVTRARVDRTFTYAAALPQKRVKQSALRRLVDTMFSGSAVGAATALMGMSDKADPAELDRLEALIEKMRRNQAQ